LLEIPSYIKNNNIYPAPLSFQWSGDIALKMYAQSDLNSNIYRAADASSFKAKMALSVCICEWTLYRLEGTLDLEDSWSRVEAAWALILDSLYSNDLEFDLAKDKYKLDSRACLGISLAHLAEAAGRYQDGDIWLAEAVTKQAVLARHICPNPKAFDAWLSDTFKATAAAFPRGVEYDKESEYYDASAETPVPRAFFDPLADPATDHPAALNAFLQSLDPSTNPYLATPEEMLAAGFTGTPYQYP
jgi:hypothetical protein